MRTRQSGREVLINAREHISTRDAERDFPLRYFRRYFFVDLESNSDARYRSINIFVRRYFPRPPVCARMIVHCDQRCVRNIRCGAFKLSWLPGIRMLNFRCAIATIYHPPNLLRPRCTESIEDFYHRTHSHRNLSLAACQTPNLWRLSLPVNAAIIPEYACLVPL